MGKFKLLVRLSFNNTPRRVTIAIVEVCLWSSLQCDWVATIVSVDIQVLYVLYIIYRI